MYINYKRLNLTFNSISLIVDRHTDTRQDYKRGGKEDERDKPWSRHSEGEDHPDGQNGSQSDLGTFINLLWSK